MKGSFKVWMIVVLMLLLLSGCASQASDSTGSAPTAQPDESPGMESEMQNRRPELQNGQERQMVMLFQAILQMDKQEGLSIDKTQAEQMLPLIRKSKEEGQMTAENETQVMALFTPGQTEFYTKLEEDMKSRRNDVSRRNSQDLTPEEREKMIEEFKAERGGSPEGEPLGKKDFGQGNGPANARGTGQSMEQQVIDLLEAKLKEVKE
ncbi:hypothetical protein [Paenibacillus eucommiae]|uniref:Lipoprotein n=1 Tax=Paenibacillus eucommiae TaxID=1355755 RepID=A0ABS4J8V3_9BACL|nr:hypothetical protein [Paenibacillus eucommiae]MBP1995501.1 hypothetical protein [Paenibacillus eucommiae]